MEYTGSGCKNCGAPLDPREGTDGVVVCNYCGSVWTLPSAREPAVLQALRQGEHELDVGKFSDAFLSFQKASELDKNEPEAYFNMALADFKVQTMKDHVRNRMQPIRFEISDRLFTEDKRYLRALSLSSPSRRAEYERRGREIDAIGKEFYRLQTSGIRYDCFLCAKVSDEHGGTTQDSHEALRLYHALKERGFSPFYSEEETKERVGSDYEALILYALYTAGCMLVVCSDEGYLQTPWVKNEYTRFLRLIRCEEKGEDSIAFAYKGKPIERLPGEDKRIQGVDLGKPDAYQLIEAFISSHEERTPALQHREYSVSYEKKNAPRTGVQKRELTISGGRTLTVSDRSKLSVAAEYVKRGEFPSAIRFLDLLTEQAGSREAYLLRFLAENSCRDEEAFAASTAPVTDFQSLERAISSTEDGKERKKLYDLLFRHALSSLDPSSCNEYFELPESDEDKIARLADALVKEALKTGDEALFEQAVKTVKDTETYIETNLAFAHAFPDRAQARYRSILEADEGHPEALYRVFFAEHHLETEQGFLWLCTAEGLSSMEELFAYGFNEFAFDALLSLALSHAENEDTCRLLDALLPLLPKEREDKLDAALGDIVLCFLRAGAFGQATRYNDLIFSQGRTAHVACCNRVLIKNKFKNALELVDLAETLTEDGDFLAATFAYAEQYPERENLYLAIGTALKQWHEQWTDKRIRTKLYQETFVAAGEIPSRAGEIGNLYKVMEDTRKAKPFKVVACVTAGCLLSFLLCVFVALGGEDRISYPFFRVLWGTADFGSSIAPLLVFLIFLTVLGVYLIFKKKGKLVRRASGILNGIVLGAISIVLIIGAIKPFAGNTTYCFGDGFTVIASRTAGGYTLEEYRGNKKDVELPQSIQGIEVKGIEDGFFQRTSIERVVLPDGITSISILTFRGGRKLKTISLSSELKEIGGSAFSYCDKLERIEFRGTLSEWETVKKDIRWDNYLKSYTILCTDGVISVE